MSGAVITTRGKGPDLVLVHGWGMHSGCWGGFADELANHYTLHLVDLPGHGQAAGEGAWHLRPVVKQILSRTPGASWLGWSLGGLVALHAALQSPEQVKSLFLIGSTPCFQGRDDWPDGMQRAVFKAFFQACSDEPAAALQRFLQLQVSGAAQASATLRQLKLLHEKNNEFSREGLLSGLDILASEDVREHLPEIQQPAVWLSGDHDRLVPATVCGYAASLMPRAYPVITPGAGHVPFLSHAPEVLEAHGQFVNRISRG